MMVDNEKSTAARVITADANNTIDKPSFTASNPSSSEYSSEKKKSGSDGCAATTSISSMMVPSTDTTLSTVTTKIDDQTNEMEFLLLDLDNSPDIGGIDDDDNENCSISSTTSSVISRYFEPTDFLPWEELYSKAEYAPHLGLAMVAGGFACLHPFVFFAGVVTAVGAVRAAEATYEYAKCMQQTKTKGLEGDDSSSNDLMIPFDCFQTSLGFGNTVDNANLEVERAVSPARSKLGDEDYLPMAKSCSTCSTNASTIGDLSDDANAKTELTHALSSSVPSIIKSPKNYQQTPKDSFDATKWVTDNFPVLPIIALKNIEFRGLNPNEFFDVFFADDAPFGFPAFHILRRDKKVQYSPWNTEVAPDKQNGNSIEFPPSIAAKERAVQYHAKTNSFLGPAYAPTKKMQRAYFVSKKMLVIDIKMTLHDIPFSKQFYLIERWVIDGTRASSSHCVYLTISSEVYFTQECAFESAVRKESTKQVCEIAKCWNAMAQAGLKRTEETRTKRLRQKEKERTKQESSSARNKNMAENTESIEIEHIDDGVANDHSNDRSGGSKRSSIRHRRRSSSKHQNHNPAQSHRRLSRSFSKLLARGSNSIKTGDSSQKLLKSPLKVRISSEERI